MIQLNQVLSVNRTFTEDLGASKKKVLQTLAERLSQSLSGVTDVEIFDQLIAREKLGSTGIGSGFAVPHCRLTGVEKPIAAFAKLPTAVDFESIDRQPVDLIFALVVPNEATDEHLQLLASVVEQVNNPDNLRKLKYSKTPEALYEQFVGA